MTTFRDMACGVSTYPPSNAPPTEPQAQLTNKWPERMCFQSDLSSNIALYTLKELHAAGRLKV